MIDRRSDTRFAPGIPLLYAGIALLASTLTRIGLALWTGMSAVPPALSPRAFISNYQELGYLKNDVLTVLSLDRKITAFHVDPVTFESTPMPVNATFADEAIAYYQTGARAYRQGALKELAAAPRTP